MRAPHIKHLLIGGGVLIAAVVLAGWPLENALPWALLLICPLVMIPMMVVMMRGGSARSHEAGSDTLERGPASQDYAGGHLPEGESASTGASRAQETRAD